MNNLDPRQAEINILGSHIQRNLQSGLINLSNGLCHQIKSIVTSNKDTYPINYEAVYEKIGSDDDLFHWHFTLVLEQAFREYGIGSPYYNEVYPIYSELIALPAGRFQYLAVREHTKKSHNPIQIPEEVIEYLKDFDTIPSKQRAIKDYIVKRCELAKFVAKYFMGYTL